MPKNKSKIRQFLASFFVPIILLVTLFLFILNIITVKFELGNAFEFLGQVFADFREFTPSDFGHQIGKLQKDEKYQDKSVVSVTPKDFQNNGLNYVYLGPRVFLLPGEYQITWELVAQQIPSNSSLAILDVYQTDGSVWARKEIKAEDFPNENFQKIHLNFKTSGGRFFEFRILYLGQGILKAGNVKIQTISKDWITFGKKTLKIFGLIWRNFIQ